MSDPYSPFHEDQRTLRDQLALDRTVLANERTLLAYIRTSLGFLVLGVTFLHFLEQVAYHFVGYAFLVVGVLIFLAGCTRFVKIRRDLKRVRPTTTDESDRSQRM
jgi:putative membrane protein